MNSKCGCSVGDVDGDRLEVHFNTICLTSINRFLFEQDCVDRSYVLLRANWLLTVPIYAGDRFNFDDDIENKKTCCR